MKPKIRSTTYVGKKTGRNFIKKALPIIGAVLALSTSGACAQILFAPDLSGTTTPTTYPSGYTTTTANGGSITYGSNSLSASDFSVNGTKAFISTTGAAPLSNSITTQFTFTPTYTYTGSSGGQADIPIFSLSTANGNNSLLSVDLYSSSYTNQDQIGLNTGIQFSGGTTTGNTTYTSSGIGSLSGLTLTLSDVETFTNTGGLNWTITNVGTLSNGATTLYNFNYTTSGAANNSFYDPVNNALSMSVGITNGPYGGGASVPYIGFLGSGATLNESNISVAVAVPEPSTYAMLLGGIALMLVIRHRRISAL